MAFNPVNLLAHLDIEGDIQDQKNGMFTIILRINQEKIVDYVRYKNLSPDECQRIINQVVKEFISPFGNRDQL